jgi:hypothetical protein
MSNEELQARVLAAIQELDVLDAVAAAAINAVLEAGYFPGAGWEYAVRQGDRVVETGFNTSGQARTWAKRNLGKVPYEVQRRRVGVWENEPEIP